MSLPDWLVERAALDEVPPASRERIATASPGELDRRVAALRDNTAAELEHYPPGPAVAEIDRRVATERRLRAERRRRRRMAWLTLATSAAAVLVVARLGAGRAPAAADPPDVLARASRAAQPDDDTRIKGDVPRLFAFRRVGEQVERLKQDTVVRAGDVIQLRYKAAGQNYGVIASVDGAGVVTLHYPLREDAPPQATAVAPETTSLPNAYALDDAPGFERFFFITASGPLDVQQALAAVRAVAQRDDSATAPLELPAGLQQWSLRLRKPARSSNHHESP